MTNRERVLVALEHRQPDRVPYHVQFTIPARARMAQYYGDPDFEAKLGNCFLVLSCHPKQTWREVGPGLVQDHFGVIWDRTVDQDIGVVSNQAVTPGNVDTYPFPEPDQPALWERIGAAAAAKGDRFALAQLGFSLFERAWALVGMENLLVAMVADPPFVHRLLERILEYNLRAIACACACDIDAMFFGDDWGCQRGLIMGPRPWREFILPRVRQMYQAVKARGKHVFIHSCGKVDELFPDLVAAGLEVFNPFQPEVIDVFAAKRRFGDQLGFYGGISTQRTLPLATPAQTREEVKRLLDEIGRSGGYFAAPAHDLPRDARPENIAAMIEVLQGQ